MRSMKGLADPQGVSPLTTIELPRRARAGCPFQPCRAKRCSNVDGVCLQGDRKHGSVPVRRGSR